MTQFVKAHAGCPRIQVAHLDVGTVAQSGVGANRLASEAGLSGIECGTPQAF